MVVRNIDRRAAIVAIGTAIAGGAIGWRSGRADAEQVTQIPEYVAPTIWNSLGAQVAQSNLAIDHALWQCESVGNITAATNLVASTMAVPSSDNTKNQWSGVIRDTQRHWHIPALVVGLDPTISGVMTRAGIILAVESLVVTNGPQVVDQSVQSQLKLYLESGAETEPGIVRGIERLMSRL